MRRWWCCLLLVGLAAGLGTRAAGAGAWTTLLRANSYTDLLLANDTLWCATLEGGLVRYDPARERFTSFTREPGGLQSNRLSALALDRAGRLWVGTQGAGVSRLGPDRASWDLLSGFDGIPSDTITVLEAEGDTVYVGTTRGIALWDGNTVAGAIPDGVNPSPFASNYINGVAQLGDSVWVSTLAGIYVSRLSDVPLTWSAVNQGLIAPAPLALARAGLELFTLVGNLPFRFDFEAGQWRTAGNWQAIGGVARMSDHQGVVALATVNGIYRWDPGAPPPFAGAPPGDWALVQGGPEYSSSLAGDTRAVFAITAHPTGTVLYAANRKGIHTLTRGCTECPVHAPPGPPGNNIINLALQSTTLYVNTFNEGVGRFDGSGWRLWLPGSCSGSVCDTTFANAIFTFALMVDRAGEKWVACWDGALEEFDDAATPPRFVHHYEAWSDPIPAPVRHSFGWSTAVDPGGGHWIGLETNGGTDPVTPLGLDYYDSTGAFVRNFRPDSVLSMRGSQIRGLVVDHRGRFWVGYTGQGLQFFDYYASPPPAIPTFQTVGGTENLYIQSLAVFGDSLWVLTTQDLRRFDARTARLVSGSIVSPPGATAQFAIRPLALGPDGSVWLGTDNGMRVYHPRGAIDDFDIRNSPLASNEVRAIAVDPASGVAWIGTSAGLNRYDPFFVDRREAGRPSLSVRLFPNPRTLTGIGAPMWIRGDANAYDGEVYDLGGRRVHRFSGVLDGHMFWDGRDEKGGVVKPGVYFVRVTSGGRTATARVALVR